MKFKVVILTLVVCMVLLWVSALAGAAQQHGQRPHMQPMPTAPTAPHWRGQHGPQRQQVQPWQYHHSYRPQRPQPRQVPMPVPPPIIYSPHRPIIVAPHTPQWNPWPEYRYLGPGRGYGQGPMFNYYYGGANGGWGFSIGPNFK